MNQLHTWLLNAKGRAMNQLHTCAYTQANKQGSIGTIVYKGVWSLALLSAVLTYATLPTTDWSGIGGLFSAIFVIATAYQQYLVYEDFHTMETTPGLASKKYGTWFGTSCERCLRYGIIISLLFGVGKIAAVVYPLLLFADTYLDKGLEQLQLGGRQRLHYIFGGIFHPDRLFLIGSLFTFVFLLAWNIGCVMLLRQCRPQQKSDDQREHALKSARTWVFIASIFLCFAYWLTVSIDFWSSMFSLIWLGVYVLTIFFVRFLNSDWLLQKALHW